MEPAPGCRGICALGTVLGFPSPAKDKPPRHDPSAPRAVWRPCLWGLCYFWVTKVGREGLWVPPR